MPDRDRCGWLLRHLHTWLDRKKGQAIHASPGYQQGWNDCIAELERELERVERVYLSDL